MLSLNIEYFQKGSQMGKLDFVQQEKTFLHTNEMKKALADIDNKFLNKEGVNNSDTMDTDLEAWLEIFEEDEVKHEICH